jgi:hypothetical protein
MDLLGDCPEELDAVQEQNILERAGFVILACLSEPNQTEGRRVRNCKRDSIFACLEILVVRLPINLRPTAAIHRTLNSPGFQRIRIDCIVSRADAAFAEIPANPLAWLIL